MLCTFSPSLTYIYLHVQTDTKGQARSSSNNKVMLTTLARDQRKLFVLLFSGRSLSFFATRALAIYEYKLAQKIQLLPSFLRSDIRTNELALL